MSLHSPLSPSSERSDPVLDDMLPPQRVIERMSSYPSLSHSSTTATSDDPHDLPPTGDLMTPIDVSVIPGRVKVLDEEQELLSRTHEGRRGLRGFSKSMQSLRGKAKSDRERSRSTSRERPPIPIVEPGLKVSAANRPAQPMPIPSSKALSPTPVRPKPQRSGSSFSSFIRKLTGKSPKPTSPSPPAHQPLLAAREPATSVKRPSPPSPPSRKPTLAIDTGNNFSSARPGHFRKTSLPLDIVGPANVERPVEPAPLTAPPRAVTLVPVDPRSVPLPPSPPSPAVVLPDEEALDFSLSPTSYERATIGLTSQGSREREIVDDAEHESSDETDDIVNPLPSASPQPSGRISTSPVSTSTINDPDVRTPLSPSFPQNQDRTLNSPAFVGVMGNSPPRQNLAFGGNAYNGRKESVRVGNPPAANLGRKESKWRKSVMNLSDTLNGQSKRVSRAPPTSFDAYQQHQQRMANNRRSCAPTLHSTGTVSAEIRQIKDKEQQDMADTFFLS